MCQNWVHQKCTGLSLTNFIYLDKSDSPYFCVNCHSDIFPFQSLSNEDFNDLFTCYRKNSFLSSLQKLPEYFSDSQNSYKPPKNFMTNPAIIMTFFMLDVNIRSLNKNFEKLEDLLTQISKLPDIIAISETKLNNKLNFNLQGYNFIQNNSKTKAGGVGMFIKENINSNLSKFPQLNVLDCEDLWVTVKINNTEKVFGVVYRHPSNNFAQFHTALKHTLITPNKQKLKYYICGDVNINLLDYDIKSNIKEYSDMLFSLGCIPLIKYPTRITQTSSTLIDHIYTNEICQKNTTHIIQDNISDHMPVSILLHNIKHQKAISTDFVRDMKAFDPDEFIIEIPQN